MKHYKICLLGAPGVGKTSLTQRFVHGCFSERYHSTIGVKIDKAHTSVGGEAVGLVIWDVQGEERYEKILPAYLRGMSGYLLVADIAAEQTLETAWRLRAEVAATQPHVPFIPLANKSDLLAAGAATTWPALAEAFVAPPILTSAKDGSGVEAAFAALAAKMHPGARSGRSS